MEENRSWEEQLQEVLDARKLWLEDTQLPPLKDHFIVYQGSFEGIYNILIKKSIIKEDPYKYEERIAEISVPVDAEILETEREEKMSQLLSTYHTHLDFLNNYYQFSLDFLDLGRIGRIVPFLGFFSWSDLSGESANFSSHNLSVLVQKIKLGADKVSSQLITNSINQLEQKKGAILVTLKQMTSYHREAYKWRVRSNILPKISPEKLNGNQALDIIKAAFPQYMEDQSFYRELVQEILDEEESERGGELKASILKKLTVRGKKQINKDDSNKDTLFQAIRYLAGTGHQLSEIAEKLETNHDILEGRNSTFMSRLVRVLPFLKGSRGKGIIYEIEYQDPSASKKRKERIAFTPFLEEIQKKAKLYLSILDQSSTASEKLNTASEEQVFGFLKENLTFLQQNHRRLIGFNEHFKTEGKGSDKIRRFRTDLSVIKNNIVKSNQKRHEYVSSKEEQAQLKRLGMQQT